MPQFAFHRMKLIAVWDVFGCLLVYISFPVQLLEGILINPDEVKVVMKHV